MPSSRCHSQLSEGVTQLIVVWRPVVPCKSILHETDALSFHGVRNHHDGDACSVGGAEPVADGVMVMSVDLANLPTEGRELVGQRFECKHLLHRPETLQLVVVDEH